MTLLVSVMTHSKQKLTSGLLIGLTITRAAKLSASKKGCGQQVRSFAAAGLFSNALESAPLILLWQTLSPIARKTVSLAAGPLERADRHQRSTHADCTDFVPRLWGSGCRFL